MWQEIVDGRIHLSKQQETCNGKSIIAKPAIKCRMAMDDMKEFDDDNEGVRLWREQYAERWEEQE